MINFIADQKSDIGNNSCISLTPSAAHFTFDVLFCTLTSEIIDLLDV